MFLFIFALMFAHADQFQNATGSLPNNQKVIWGKLPTDSLIKPMLTKYIVNEMVPVRPLPGHHFNLKANNNCSMHPPQILKAQFLQCQFPEPGIQKINLFICDDKETFCKMEKITIEVTAPKGFAEAQDKKAKKEVLYVPKAELKAPPGFIKNDSAKAIAQAQKENKLLLISFSAQWCPSCNMLNENVYQSQKFQDETKDIVKLIVDVDSDLSWDLKERFYVANYPTIVLTTSSLNEIGRLTDYRTPQAMSVWLKQMRDLQGEPIDFTISKVQTMADSAKNPTFKAEYEKKVLRLAQWYLDQDQPEKAKAVLKKIDSKKGERIATEAAWKIVDKTDDKTKISKALQTLITKFPQDVDVSTWAQELSTLDAKAAKKLVSKVQSNVEKWTTGNAIDSTDMLKAEVFSNLAEVYENIGEPVKARQNYAYCAREYTTLASESPLKTPRGANMEKGFCLVKAGQPQEALSLFQNLANVYPNEFALNFYYAKALVDTGDTKKALVFSKKALDGGYGDNMIRAATLKAQIELNMKDLIGAEQTVNQALDKIYLPSTTKIRTHRYVTNLKSILAKIEVQKSQQKDEK